jgi:tetratricopeptide (TPR) repeat protein
LEALPNFIKIELYELNATEAESAIRAKLAQLYPARSGALPIGLVDKLMMRSQGNPFYLEELLNYVRDRGLDPADLNQIELPDSLHALILSRIDQLSEREKNTLRVASIIGRLFRVEWLTGYYPDLGGTNRVQSDLEQLAGLDITPLDTPEPELAYLFKHIVTHEVTYESLPFATRAKLHEQLAKYLEGSGAPVDTIAHHYGRSDNTSKQREYFQKAAQAALAVSAFNTAVEYLTCLLELTPATDPARSALALQLADAHRGLGDLPAARAAIEQAQAAAKTDTDRASVLAMLGGMTSELGDYAEAQTILAQAVPLARISGDQMALCRALSELGGVNWVLGKLDDAKVALDESLALARALGDVTRELLALMRLGLVIGAQGDLDEKERLFTEVHTRAVAAGNRFRAMSALNNLGAVAAERKDYAGARDYYQQSLALAREIGSQSFIALGLINLADTDIKLGQLSAVREGLREGLALAQRLGALPLAGEAVMYFGNLAHAEGQTERALALIGLARNHPAWISDNQREMDAALAEWALDPAVVEAGLNKGSELDWDATIKELLS